MCTNSITMVVKLKKIALKLLTEEAKHVGRWWRGQTTCEWERKATLTCKVRKHSKKVGTSAQEHARHVGMWARKHEKHVDMWTRKHAKHVSMLACQYAEHVSKQGTLVHEDVFSTQGLCFHRFSHKQFSKCLF